MCVVVGMMLALTASSRHLAASTGVVVYVQKSGIILQPKREAKKSKKSEENHKENSINKSKQSAQVFARNIRFNLNE